MPSINKSSKLSIILASLRESRMPPTRQQTRADHSAKSPNQLDE
ncbi:hypothetical protein RMSM_06954 [Rhodopirellula maiorica SM1]|uniref:Uncharacterized protein n=1 Tax=Rhodopirellula maiorica SM1 TaxID=1265738 RepID=M5RL65_9BACT|nr:hypothetical protein RMSM_06954 [Rhodopirellula maiorica SM1]